MPNVWIVLAKKKKEMSVKLEDSLFILLVFFFRTMSFDCCFVLQVMVLNIYGSFFVLKQLTILSYKSTVTALLFIDLY